MTVKEALINHMKKNGYTGLFNDGVCGCKIDNLAPDEGCSKVMLSCELGYWVNCKTCANKECRSVGEPATTMEKKCWRKTNNKTF